MILPKRVTIKWNDWHPNSQAAFDVRLVNFAEASYQLHVLSRLVERQAELLAKIRGWK